MKLPTQLKVAAICVSVAGCASVNRGCSVFGAENFGANWVVVQYDMNGKPYNCWRLQNVSITNEPGSDGIYWAEGTLGHLVHISGWYNRVQVSRGDYASAARLIGVDIRQCANGHYPASEAAPA